MEGVDDIMAAVMDTQISSFSAISDLYPDSYVVVEIVSIDYNNGEELGRVLGVYDSFEDAVNASDDFDSMRTTILPGINCMSCLGGLALNTFQSFQTA